MPYSTKVIAEQDQSTSKWSGGTTTQIAIYPETAAYAERNFSWRLSSATVDLEESVFTSLPGISRLIMVLDGEMKLEHEGHHRCFLRPMEQDAFNGDWTTRSVGKVRDFNLMMTSGCTGKLTAILLTTAQKWQAVNDWVRDLHVKTWSAFYCIDGQVQAAIDSLPAQILHTGDLLLIEMEQQSQPIALTLTPGSGQSARLVRADIGL